MISKLTSEEIRYIKTRKKSKQLIFAVLFKYYQHTLQFIDDISNVPQSILQQLSEELSVPPNIDKISSRTYDNFSVLIRSYFNTTFPKKTDYKQLVNWISEELLPDKHLTEQEIKNLAASHLQKIGIEPFKAKIMTRVINDAVNNYEKILFANLHKSLSHEQEAKLNGLLLPYKDGRSYLGWINKEFNNPSLKSMLNLIDQLSIIKELNIDMTAIDSIPRKRILHYAESFTRLSPSHLKSRHDKDRCANLIFYCYIRQQQLIDKVIDMFSSISHTMIHKSERRIVKNIVLQIKKIYGQDTMLFNIAEACLSDPDATIRNKIYPVIAEHKLKNIIDNYKKDGATYQNILHEKVRSSYARHYRRIVQPLLESIIFKSNNNEHQPILEGIRIIKKYFDSCKKYFPINENVPLECIPQKWQKQVIDQETGGIKRVCYEVYLLKVLTNHIKCREIWIEGSIKHHNPDNDLPNDFDQHKEEHCNNLSLPLNADEFINSIKQQMDLALTTFNNTIPKNKKVKISDKKGGRFVVSPLKPQVESANVSIIKKHLQDKWQTINLIDVLKEVQLNINFTNDFVSYGDKIYLSPDELSERILLAIYGFGTNVGLKHICSGNDHITYAQLRHIKNYFLSTDNLKNTIKKLANTLFKVRDYKVWGSKPIAVACDSTQFSAYFQNMLSEYHNRYGGRGVMIYWHVEKKATCIHSQLKSVSSSEVSSMINGILNHCTEMSVQKSYVDTHGQSEVGFAFSYLLGFNLMPRLANLSRQKLYQCELGDYQKYSNLQPILSDTIKWQLIKDQYYQLVKYTVAMKEGYAEPDSILRRFTKNNFKHPIYAALSQLGKVIKTIFICNYLMHEGVRREIHEGLNVVELWNGVSKFIFYGRSGEISSNNINAQEISVLCLHMLQLSMIYINTLLIQQIISEYSFADKLTLEDKRALTPLIYEHINPYGLFPLDITKRLPHIKYKEVA